MVNTKHDTASYESCSYKHDILTDGNALYDAFLKSKKNSDWKQQVQKFETTYLLGLGRMQRELRDGTYQFKDGNTFIIQERGKTRCITGEQIEDRIVEHVLCDEIINPAIKKYLIYDNGASQKGKGISFTRKRLETHLHRYYQKHGNNKGYVLLIDFSKYYDNIRHDILMDMFKKYIHNENALKLIQQIIDRQKVDVSYMTDEEYNECMNGVFNSIEHDKIDKTLLTGEKWLPKHINIGNQISQSAGILYRTPIDNYVKIVKGVKEYAGYSDDSYAIHESKKFLQDLLADIIYIAKDIGITVNERKTRICKLSEKWRFLQIQYSLTKTGRVIHKINPKNVTIMRRKMKKLAGQLSAQEFCDWIYSWMNSNTRYLSNDQRENIYELQEILLSKYYPQSIATKNGL